MSEKLFSSEVDPKTGDLLLYNDGTWIVRELPRVGAKRK